jgi:hypothetical protein
MSNSSIICKHCNEPLNLAIKKKIDNVEYKSCPKCSVTHGSQHVYFPSPDEFGTSQARESINNPAGVQSYCESCRPPAEKDNPSKVWRNGTFCEDL